MLKYNYFRPEQPPSVDRPKIILFHAWFHHTPCLKNVTSLACYSFDAHEWILIFFWQKCYR